MMFDPRFLETPLLGEVLLNVPDGLGLSEGNMFAQDFTESTLYVQRAVRHQALTAEHGLFVQRAVRSSQLEAGIRMRALDVWFTLTPEINDTFNVFTWAYAAMTGRDDGNMTLEKS
jgi:hypothetical protein